MNKSKNKKKLLVLGISLLCILGSVITANAMDSECRHWYDDGICMKCGNVCMHTYEDLHGQCSECYKICEHLYENGNCTKCGKFENECESIGFNDIGVYYSANIEYNTDGPLTWNTYKFYDKNVNEVATLELLHGYDYSKFWVTVDGVTQEYDNATLGYDEDGAYLEISWFEGIVTEGYGIIEGYEYEYLVLDSSETIPEMDVELEIVWDETARPGVVAWNNADDEGVVMYRLQLWRGDVYVAYGYAYDGEDDEYEIDFSPYINESGTYIVRLIAIGDKNSGVTNVYSNEFVYEKPDEELGTVEKIWWTAKEGDEYPTILNWMAVPGAVGYKVNLAVNDEWGWSSYCHINYIHYGDEMVASVDLSEKIEEQLTAIESGWEDLASCTCEIKALSGNITVIANASSVLETTEEDYVLLETVEEEIMNSLEASTAATVIEDIAQIGMDTMADAMQNNTEILNVVEALETEFVEANRIEVLAPIVEHAKLTADAIKAVIGVGFNATSDCEIGIVISEAAEQEDVNENLYENVVQTDITLKLGGEALKDELEAPVTITMKIPTGVEEDRLVIIHYLDNGDKEIIYPIVNDDGTITFSTKSFSTFVFANLVGKYVKNDTAEVELSINEEGHTFIDAGKVWQPTLTISPADADVELVWSSLDKSVATVGADGVISPVSDGTTVVTVATKDGSASASCTITVAISQYESIDYSAVFDFEYYIEKYPEVVEEYGNGSCKAIYHFVEYGMALGYQANEEFNLVAYKSNYPDLGVAFGSDNVKYYMHYINNGRAEGRNAKVVLVESDTKYYGVEYAEVYNYDYYINNNPDLKAAFGDNKAAALIHFANMGMKEGRQACENFGAKIYKFNYPELQESFGEDMVLYYHHYMNYGKDEGRNGATRDFSAYCVYEGVNYTPVYNYEDYIERNPDVFNAYGLDANAVLKHFVTVGMAEGRQGSDDFNYNIYRSNYPDLEVAFGENRAEYYHHYINSGFNEGRNAATSNYTSDTVYAGVDYADVYSYDYYVTANPDVAAAIGDNKIAILAHFVRNGMAEGRQGSAEFNVHVYMEKNSDLVEVYGSDLKAYYMHYISEGKAEGRVAN